MSKQRFGWGHLMSGLAGGLIAALVLAVVPATGANGDNLVLGATNRAGRSTWLTSKGPSVMKLNNTGGNPVLDLRNGGAAAPLKVDSEVVVNGLNADAVDGWDAPALAPRIATASSSDITTVGNDMLVTNIHAARAGMLLIGLNIDIERSGTEGPDEVFCGVVVDDSSAGWAGSGSHGIQLSDTNGSNTEENCNITEFHYVDSGGTYKVEGQVVSVDADGNTEIGNGNLWVVWFPVDGTGGGFF